MNIIQVENLTRTFNSFR